VKMDCRRMLTRHEGWMVNGLLSFRHMIWSLSEWAIGLVERHTIKT
jgi:hypothetical protein